LEMVNYVQEAFQDMLVENDWLDSSTKASALDKARNIRRVIGYPDFILDDKKLDDFYSGLSVLETDSYGQMTEKLARWRNDLEFLSLIMRANRSEVPETGLYLNGKLTQGENIADHAGVKVAFRNYLKKFGEEKPLRGLEEYNSEQMFFIGYAAVFCERETTGRLIEQILRDEHSPSKYRVNQVLANQAEFAAAFNCPVGTPMNPASRCAVW
uniref:Peptidase_M13 domain-containing protein n=1 Tax=Angiostrongylus cantonensis TaxID=6313 RepID=A0A158P7B7_ANGCA